MKYLVLCAISIFLITLFFGLRPKEYNFINNVNWIDGEAGIHFDKYGIVYADLANGFDREVFSDRDNFSIEIAIRPESFTQEGFNLILSIYDGRDSEQLLIGQWKSYIIVMNGDDYSNKKKIKRITAGMDPKSLEKIFISITTGIEGTEIYFNGEIIKSRSYFNLLFPGKNTPKITLGNSVYGIHPWAGDIYGLAIFREKLEKETVINHFDNWLKSHCFSPIGQDNPLLLYIFDEKTGTRAFDHARGNNHLQISEWFNIPKKRILAPPWFDFKFDIHFLKDVLVNLLGFIPLSFVLSATLMKFGGRLEKYHIIVTIFLCFITSIGIEISQAWLPSRSSQLLDLLLNMCGAVMGLVIIGVSNICSKYFKIQDSCLILSNNSY